MSATECKKAHRTTVGGVGLYSSATDVSNFLSGLCPDGGGLSAQAR